MLSQKFSKISRFYTTFSHFLHISLANRTRILYNSCRPIRKDDKMVDTSHLTALKAYKQTTRTPRGLTEDQVEDFLITLLKLVDEYETLEAKADTKTAKWGSIHRKMLEHFPTLSITTEGLRSHYRRLKEPKMHQICLRKDDRRVGRKLGESIARALRKRQSVEYLAERYGITVEEVLGEISKLQINGYTNLKVWKDGDTIYAQNNGGTVPKTNRHDLSDRLGRQREITFAVIGDTHLGSEYADEEALHNFYNIVADRGITTVFHGGDLTEGFNPRRVHTFLGNRAIGFDAQMEYTIANYPYREGVTTYVIGGNHDNWYHQQGLANIVKTVSNVRDDIVYLGDDYAKIDITPHITLALVHPNDGSSGNVFNKLQEHIDKSSPERLATINVLAHYHKIGYIKHRGVYGLYPASFQKESNWMKQNNLRSYVGGWIITLKVDKEGKLLNLVTEYVDYE